MLGCFAVGGVYNHYKEEQQNDHVVKVEKNNLKAPKQYASYDDDNYTITLTADELNSYTFENLAYATNHVETFSDIQSNWVFSYNSYEFNGDECIVNDYLWYMPVDTEYDAQLVFYLDINKDTYGKFALLNMDDENISFEYNLVFNTQNTYYGNVKNAIELDIQANQPVSIGESIIGSIASGLGIIPNIAGEFLAGFSKLLWNNNQLTDFAIYSLVFLGIAITFAIVKLVLMIVRNNTGA